MFWALLSAWINSLTFNEFFRFALEDKSVL
jgi:hypothetical protein